MSKAEAFRQNIQNPKMSFSRKKVNWFRPHHNR